MKQELAGLASQSPTPSIGSTFLAPHTDNIQSRLSHQTVFSAKSRSRARVG